MRSQVVHFYQGLYMKTNTWCPTVDGLQFASIEEDERLSLERDFSKEEVIQVIKEMVIREMQENYYLIFFMFASQLYFYVLGPSSLLGYQYFNLGSKVIFVIR